MQTTRNLNINKTLYLASAEYFKCGEFDGWYDVAFNTKNKPKTL